MDGPKRTLIQNTQGQYTITIPIDIIRMMGAKKGDKFTFIYQPTDTLMLTRMGCDA